MKECNYRQFKVIFCFNSSLKNDCLSLRIKWVDLSWRQFNLVLLVQTENVQVVCSNLMWIKEAFIYLSL